LFPEGEHDLVDAESEHVLDYPIAVIAASVLHGPLTGAHAAGAVPDGVWAGK